MWNLISVWFNTFVRSIADVYVEIDVILDISVNEI